MLKINKKSNIFVPSYKLQILFRKKLHRGLVKFKKSKSQLITLRAPKHFNIGKYKIYTLNFKTLNLSKIKFYPTRTNLLLTNSQHLFKCFEKMLNGNIYAFFKSIKIQTLTKFKITWLEF